MTQQLRSRTPAPPRKLDLPKMTYERFLESDFQNPHVEWVKGEVVETAPVGDEHQDLGGFLLMVLRHFAEEHELGVVRYEPFNMKTGPDLPGRSPDLLFLSRKNRSRLKKGHLKGPADVAVEIISPGSRGTDRGEKYYEYEAGRVKEYWLLDPERKRAEFYRLGRDKQYHLIEIGADGVFRSAVVKGLWFRVDWFWQRPLPKGTAILKEWGLV